MVGERESEEAGSWELESTAISNTGAPSQWRIIGSLVISNSQKCSSKSLLSFTFLNQYFFLGQNSLFQISISTSEIFPSSRFRVLNQQLSGSFSSICESRNSMLSSPVQFMCSLTLHNVRFPPPAASSSLSAYSGSRQTNEN